jgi:hypothetical protein
MSHVAEGMYNKCVATKYGMKHNYIVSYVAAESSKKVFKMSYWLSFESFVKHLQHVLHPNAL